LPDDVEKHIDMLVSLDDETHYDMTYAEVKTFIEDDVRSLVSLGSEATEELCSLLQDPHTWSCFFSLKALKEMNDPRAISPLIEFIKNNDDDLGYAETAMFALSNIGSEAIEPTMKAITADFKKHDYNPFLVGSLTNIVDPKVYSFMKKITEDFVSHPQKYADWFRIDDFTYDFVEQENKAILPLLNKILQTSDLDNWQKIELQDTIMALDDPEWFEDHKKQTEEILRLSGLTDIIADMGVDSNIDERIPRDDVPFTGNTAIYALVNDKKDPIKIEEDNRDQYIRLLYSIEKSIVNEYEYDSSLKDRDVIFILKHVRDNLFKKKYSPKANLEKAIVNNLKLALTGSDYSRFEVKASVKYVYNSVKRHKKVDGKQGYVKFISSMIGEP